MSKQPASRFFRLALLRGRLLALGLLLVCAAIFVLILWLHHLPWQAAGYAALLCLLPLGLAFVWDYARQRARWRMLARLGEGLPESLAHLPAPQAPMEESYQRLLAGMAALYRQRVTADDQRYRQMTDYYTLWGHQIKTPIAGMRLLLAQEDSHLGRQLTGELFKVEQYAEMALHYLRLDAQTSDFVFAPCDLHQLCSRAARKFAAQFVSKRLSLHIDVPAGTMVRSDEKWLTLAVEQLLSNAVKYTQKGGVRILWDEKARTLTIRDSGIGISPQDLPRVFEQGFTGYNGRVDRQSTGIGLFLCRQVCNKLGMAVRLASQPGQGTQAMLVFPQDSQGFE